MTRSFVDLFGRHAVVEAYAQGRVNLIGEHTDYNDGLVLPTPIPQRTVVHLAPAEQPRVRAWSANVPPTDRLPEYRLGDERPRRDWLDYVQGVTATLREAGIPVSGFDVGISSTIPLGSGLSSSAALLVALVRGLRQAFALDLDDVAVATLAHRAEYAFVGAPVGIMDQMVCSLGRNGHALYLDTRTLETEQVPFPADLDLVVIDSGVHHAHAAGEYATRRRECEQAATRLGVGMLRDVAPGSATFAKLEALPATLARRARHVVTENQRVITLRLALETRDTATCARVLAEGHRSLRDDFEVSTPEVDVLVELMAAQPAVFGARMTGGGFGGSIVALAEAGRGRAAGLAASDEYVRRVGRQATVLVPSAALD